MGRLCLLDLVRSKRVCEVFDLFDEVDVHNAFEHIVALRYSQPTALPGKKQRKELYRLNGVVLYYFTC